MHEFSNDEMVRVMLTSQAEARTSIWHARPHHPAAWKSGSEHGHGNSKDQASLLAVSLGGPWRRRRLFCRGFSSFTIGVVPVIDPAAFRGSSLGSASP